MQPAPGLSKGERCLSHGYAFGITRGYRDESPCWDFWLLQLKLVTLDGSPPVLRGCVARQGIITL